MQVSPVSHDGRGLKPRQRADRRHAAVVSPVSHDGRGLKLRRGLQGARRRAVSPVSHDGRGLKPAAQVRARLKGSCLARQS